MKNEESIFDAADYILMAINNINNFKDFLQYKEEIIKAILDIRNSITKLLKNKKKNLKKPNKIQQNETKSSNEINNKSYLSSMLGLKFNYDNYFDQKDLRVLTQNEEIMKGNIINNENCIKNTNINKNNIIYNKSLRNKFKINNNSSNSSNNNFSRKYLVYNSIYPIKSENKKEKLSLIADIIMKINNEDYLYEILTKLLGDDLTDKLMSSDVSDEFLEVVQNAIKEIEYLKENDDINRKNKIKNEEFEEKPKKFQLEKIMKNRKKPDIKRSFSSKKFNNKNKKNKIYKEFNFEKNLRKNETTENFDKNNNNIMNNKYIKKEKPFISATNPYGNYFDAPLQYGGLSKLGQK